MILVGLITRKRSWVVIAAIFLYVASMPLVSTPLMQMIEGSTTKLSPQDTPSADAIVVLGGMIDWIRSSQGVVPEWGDPDRFWDGVELVKAGRAPILVFTGGKLPWQLGDETEGDVLKHYAQLLQVPGEKIWVTEKVENTADEAKAVAKMLESTKRKIILVTSAFHMNRAKGLFNREGFQVFAYPVDFKGGGVNLSTAFLPSPNALSVTDLCIREMVGRLYYQLRSYLN